MPYAAVRRYAIGWIEKRASETAAPMCRYHSRRAKTDCCSSVTMPRNSATMAPRPLLSVALGDRGVIVLPLQTLLDYLEAGESVDDSLDRFTLVTREQVIAFSRRQRPE